MDLQELADKLRDGNPVLEFDKNDFSTIKIIINDDDSPEVQTVKSNIEFTVNSSREAIKVLTELGKSSGNPRYFETIATLINTMNASNHQLITINRDKIKHNTDNNKKQVPVLTANNDSNKPIEGTVMMTSSDMMKDVTGDSND